MEIIWWLIAISVVLISGVFGVLYGHLSAQVAGVRKDLQTERAYNREMWAYCRRLLDLYYRHRCEGAPDPDPLPDEP